MEDDGLTLLEEMHRLVLRVRWFRWRHREIDADRRHPFRRLSARLSLYRPTWAERNENTVDATP